MNVTASKMFSLNKNIHFSLKKSWYPCKVISNVVWYSIALSDGDTQINLWFYHELRREYIVWWCSLCEYVEVDEDTSTTCLMISVWIALIRETYSSICFFKSALPVRHGYQINATYANLNPHFGCERRLLGGTTAVNAGRGGSLERWERRQN